MRVRPLQRHLRVYVQAYSPFRVHVYIMIWHIPLLAFPTCEFDCWLKLQAESDSEPVALANSCDAELRLRLRCDR